MQNYVYLLCRTTFLTLCLFRARSTNILLVYSTVGIYNTCMRDTLHQVTLFNQSFCTIVRVINDVHYFFHLNSFSWSYSASDINSTQMLLSTVTSFEMPAAKIATVFSNSALPEIWTDWCSGMRVESSSFLWRQNWYWGYSFSQILILFDINSPILNDFKIVSKYTSSFYSHRLCNDGGLNL